MPLQPKRGKDFNKGNVLEAVSVTDGMVEAILDKGRAFL